MVFLPVSPRSLYQILGTPTKGVPGSEDTRRGPLTGHLANKAALSAFQNAVSHLAAPLRVITLQGGVKEAGGPTPITRRSRLSPQSQGGSYCTCPVCSGLRDGLWPVPLAHTR